MTVTHNGTVDAPTAQVPDDAISSPADTATPAGRADTIEDRIKLGILAVIMLAALLASFTHMKDWTMHWMPAGTHVAFGWANAVISELVPLAATLSLRKRLRQGKPVMSYALVILLAGAALSLAAQLSAVGADASISAKFLAALPALAFLFLSKLVMGDLDSGRKHADAETERRHQADIEAAEAAEAVRAARAETAAAQQALAETEARAHAEAELARQETAARLEAETRTVEAEARAETAEHQQAEIHAAAQADIAREKQALAEAIETSRRAQDRAVRHAEAAHLAQGRLAEAREAADRATEARTLAEHNAATQLRQVRAAAEQAEHRAQQIIATETATRLQAEERATQHAEVLQQLKAQLTEAQRFAEQQSTARVVAEQHATELERSRDGALTELERVRRHLARAQQRAETSGNTHAKNSRPPNRKVLATVPAVLPDNLPDVDTVRPETVALVLAARAQHPDAKQVELSALTGVSDRTIRKVLNAVPADVVGAVLAITGGHTAAA